MSVEQTVPSPVRIKVAQYSAHLIVSRAASVLREWWSIMTYVWNQQTVQVCEIQLSLIKRMHHYILTCALTVRPQASTFCVHFALRIVVFIKSSVVLVVTCVN